MPSVVVIREVLVVGLVQQYIGVGGYMDLEAPNRLLREDRAVSGAILAMDEAYREAQSSVNPSGQPDWIHEQALGNVTGTGLLSRRRW